LYIAATSARMSEWILVLRWAMAERWLACERALLWDVDIRLISLRPLNAGLRARPPRLCLPQPSRLRLRTLAHSMRRRMQLMRAHCTVRVLVLGLSRARRTRAHSTDAVLDRRAVTMHLAPVTARAARHRPTWCLALTSRAQPRVMAAISARPPRRVRPRPRRWPFPVPVLPRGAHRRRIIIIISHNNIPHLLSSCKHTIPAWRSTPVSRLWIRALFRRPGGKTTRGCTR